ncbi:PKD domain-containing protein [Persicirhabdus sediminis]|uniref:PKD domain-containing protein n=1 Tax=Persicirhabdus sediminis TaxID=454144 RepID=A0A8J7MEQ9_9BACT|nr:PKD domain-containing protein [Persicirhabdus sediminis]
MCLSPSAWSQASYKIGDFETEVVRLNNGQPIISRATFTAAGLEVDNTDAGKHVGGYNINGPSLIRVPSWLADDEKADPTAEYYLYFAGHYGRSIRMAWAANIEGPYTLFNNEAGDDDGYPGYGVLDVNSNIDLVDDNQLKASDCASPDVIVDEENEQLLLFFHVNSSTGDESALGNNYFNTGGQTSWVATSRTGLNFNGGDDVESDTYGDGEPGHGIKAQRLANAYMRVFTDPNGHYHAFTNYGPIWKAPAEGIWSAAWEHEKWAINSGTTGSTADAQVTGGGNPVWMNLYNNYLINGLTTERGYAGFSGDSGLYNQNAPRTGAPRHFATRQLNDGVTLEVYYTCRGEKPESVYKTTMDMSTGDYTSWTTDVTGDSWVHERVLFPEEEWEGAIRSLAYSKNGGEANKRAIRDPDVFTDVDGKTYLLYSAGPEEGIGIASLNNKPVAVATISSLEVEGGELVYFDASESYDTDGSIVSYQWDFADASRPSQRIAHTHAFQLAGVYPVMLTVIDDLGGENSLVVNVTVNSSVQHSDGDIMPDSWELANGSDLNAADGQLDNNGNGYTNEDEYILGMQAKASSAVFFVQSQIDDGKKVTVSWPSIHDRFYAIYKSTDLLNWQLVAEDIEPTVPVNQIEFDLQDEDKVFIRVEASMP